MASKNLFLFWHPRLTVRALATLIRVWKHCQIASKSPWMPELLLPTFSRLFNLTALLLAQDKMENPCSGGLSQLSTHTQEYGISLQIPPLHFRYDPINVRIYCLCFSPLAASIGVTDFQ